MGIMNQGPSVSHATYDANKDPFEMKYGLTYYGKLKTLNSSEITASIAGIGMETLDRDTFDPATLYDAIAETGCKYARLQSGWKKCETVPGQYDFSWLDEQVDNLLLRGIQPWLSASFGNPLYTPVEDYDEHIKEYTVKGEVPPSGVKRGYVGEVPLYHGEYAMTGWKNYLRAMALHFKGRVKYVEIWNEPDCRGFWRHKGISLYDNSTTEDKIKFAEDYVEFVKQSSIAIKEVIPDMKIIAGVANPGSLHSKIASRENIGDFIDVYSFHNYGTTPERFTYEKAEYIRSLIGKSDKKIEFWQGEAGRSLAAHHPGEYCTTEYTQAKFITRRLFCDFITHMDMSSIFTASDLTSYFEDGSDQAFGIFKANPTAPRLAAFAFQSMCTILADLEHDPEALLTVTPPDGNVHSSILQYNMMQGAFRLKGYPAITAYVPEDVGLSVNPVLAEMTYRGDLNYQFKEPVILDPIRQNICRMDKSMFTTPDWAAGGTVIAPVSLVDYPLIITELAALR